jgi:hypothetical protein
MIKLEIFPNYIEYYEYHELTRKNSGETIQQDWIMFDSVEAALEYFNDSCGI